MRLHCIFFYVFTLATTGTCYAQKCRTNAKVISSAADLRQSIKNDPAKKLVALKDAAPGVLIDLRYATTNNFIKTVLYHHPVAYLREAPARALGLAEDELRRQGLTLKIYDAFRPFSVTCRIWRAVPDRRYAANPMKGSNHNRGLAVDITLADLKTGKELDMGTPFDSFTDTAHHSFMLLPAKVLANRRLLKKTMRKYGFDIVPDEWWHYQWKNDRDYEVLDLDFDDLR